MQLTQFFSEQLGREPARTRGALTNLPEGKDNWTPHPTVYLRLLERPVPAIYGPSADDQHFA